MKKLVLFFTVVLFVTSVFSQVPQKMSYQAVIRNSSNQLVCTSKLGMQISILKDSATGAPVYVETQTPTTNNYGMISLEIGSGTIITGNFSSIDWAGDIYFIKTEIDLNGGVNYSISGTSQMLSVPYALYAKTSGSSIPGPKGDTGTQGAKGDQGVAGKDGNDGMSAYQVWLNAGNTGTTAQFIASLKGTQGVKGDTGAQGLQGVQGPQGVQGAQGLTGATGQQGLIGATGPQGPAGPAVSTSAVCSSADWWQTSSIIGVTYYCSSSSCSCNGGVLVSSVKGPCTVTSNTGTCSASNYTNSNGQTCYGQCCVCKPN